MRKKITSRVANFPSISLVQPTTNSATGIWNNTDVFFENKANLFPKPITELVIFNYGTQNTAITGGWTYDDCWSAPGTSGVGTTSSFFTIDGNGLSIRSPYWGCGTASTNNNVNLAGVKSVTITYSGSNLAYYSNGSISWPLSDGSRQGFTLQNCCGFPSTIALTTVTVNITPGLSGGVGKIDFGAGNTDAGTLFLHALKFNY